MVGITLSKDDVIESFVRSSGPGGQNVNKVATCVVLLHKPTGIIVKCQKSRSQFFNREQAWDMLREALQQREDQRRLYRQSLKEKQRRQNRKRSRSAKERILVDKKKKTLKKQNRKKLIWQE